MSSENVNERIKAFVGDKKFLSPSTHECKRDVRTACKKCGKLYVTKHVCTVTKGDISK